MFKKFKDKLAEEMKQSPARLQASVQQLAQAVVSPALSNSSILEASASNDNFSLTEDGDETPKNTPAKHNFQNVDLMSPSLNRIEISRRSSVSSVTSDASSLFPMYESPPNLYHLQSDMDQSASEVDDTISPHLDRVTKDQLYSAYRKVQSKYHKYRGRYTDLATHYRELEKVKTRLESVLVETQDKVLRRVTDLKEQCQLEQQAKAHLEEALRNDIEEKDHIINTLNTKVKLLQISGPLENSVSEDVQQKISSKVNLIDLTNEPSNDESNALSTENTQLKDKLKKLESLVLKYKESLKRNKEKFTEVMKEKNTLQNDYEALKSSTAEGMRTMEDELSAARNEIEKLTEQVDILHKREEESAISLAENKLSVHRELEEKEEQIKQLRIDLKHTTEDKENLNEVMARYKTELSKLKSSHPDLNLTGSKDTIAYDMPKEKIEAMRFTQQVEIKHHEEVGKEARSEKNENTLEEVMLCLKEKKVEIQDLQHKLNELEKQKVEYKHDKETLQAELSTCKIIYLELKSEYDAQRIIAEEQRKEANASIEKLQATVQSIDKELENMRNALIDRDEVCENYSKKVQQYTTILEKAKQKLTEQETQIKCLKDRLEDKTEISKIQEELENKKTELNAIQHELELCKSTIDDFKNKVQADGSVITLLKKERSDLINRLVYYNDCMQRLKQDYIDVKDIVKKEISSQMVKISNLNMTLAVSFIKFEEENMALKSEVDELHTKIKNSEQLASKEIELQSKLAHLMNIKSTLETELRNSNERLKEMTLKCNQYDELNITNNKLLAEIDNINFKIHDLKKISNKLTESQQEIKVLQERLRGLENLESVNHALSTEIGDLREKHAQANRAFKEVDELNSKLREATDVITSLNTESTTNQDMLREELHASKLEVIRLKDDLAEKENEIKVRDEKLANEEKHIAHLKSICDSHIQTIEEHVRKYLNLEAEYQATRETHAKETAELMENNKVLQETVNVKLVQLKKMKIVKERQSKMVEDMNAELNELKTKHIELSNKLETSEKQMESLKSELDATVIHRNVLEEENMRLGTDLNSLRIKIKEMKYAHDEYIELKSDFNFLNQKYADIETNKTELIFEQIALKKRIVELENINFSNKELQVHINKLQSKISSLEAVRAENEKLLSKIDALQSTKNSSPEAIKVLEDLLMEKDAEIKLLEDKNSNMSQEIGNLKHFSLEVDERKKETDALKNAFALSEKQIVNLQSEINSLVRTNDALQKELNTIRNDEDAKCQLNSDKLHVENKRLEAQLDEALITFQAKETQMQLMNNELRTQANQLREQLTTSEEEQGMRLKQLVKEFQAQLHDKEEELQAALEKRFDRQHNYESNLVQQYKEQLKDCQIELTEKSEQLESLALEQKDAVAEKGKDINRMVETIAQIQKEHANEIKELDKKWKALVQQRIDNLQAKHEEELNELTKEWQNERKRDVQTEAVSEELESTSRVAMAAIQTSTGSIHTLQQTLTSQRRELAELRKLLKLRHDTLEDSTEIEYLRNILFEYMMGRETMVLARVIAAVVKFDQEQTTKILKKEEDKLTLFGSLGLTS